jgi:hypothetical protein
MATRLPANDAQPTSGRRCAMSKYCSVVVAALAAASMLFAAQAAEARVVQQREIATTMVVVGGGHTSGAQDCYVAPCPSPRPERVCDDVVHLGSVWVVAELRVPCGAARALVLKLFRANPNLPGPGLPGWNCHGAKGPNVQGHCEDSSSPKGKVRAIFWWLDEGGEPTAPCGEPTTVTVTVVAAISCFRDRGGAKVSTTTVRLNGIDVVPARGTEVRLDTGSARLTTTGPAVVRLPFGPYGTRSFVPITRGVLDWNLRKVKPFDVRGRTTEIGELKVTGSAALRFEPGMARGSVSVELPQILGGFSGDVAIRATNAHGVRDDGIKLGFKGAVVERLGLKEGSLALSRSATGAFHWDGKVAVDLGRVELIVELGIGPGDGYFRLAGGLDGINRQVYRGIFLQRLGVSGQRNPLKFGGNIGFSAGPQIDTKIFGKLEAASIDGTYELELGNPLCYQGTGKGRLVIGDLFDTRFRMCSNGLVEGDYGVRLPASLLFGFGVEGRLRGWIAQNLAFNLEGNPKIELPGPDATGHAVVSSTGIGACLSVGPSVGWGYRWGDRRPTFMARSCGIGRWQAARPQAARAAGPGQAFTVRRGQRLAVFSAVGTNAAPIVTLTGPGGERVTATAAGYADARFRVAQDPSEHISYFAVADPTPGRWQFTPEPGSAPVSAFRSASPHPPVRIRARVRRGPRRTRRLDYRVAGLAGGRVRFVESGAGLRRVLGTTRRARGALRFRPAPGLSARRSIVAAVVRDGIPEPARPVARFRARTRRAAPPRRVRIGARGLRRVITWSGPRDRAYRVLVRTSDGRRLLFLPGRRHRVTVRPVVGGTRLRATVRALDPLGRPGRARTAWSPRGRKPPRRSATPCAAAIARASC